MDGYKKRDFKWVAEHKACVFEGRVLDATEVNEKCEIAFKRNADLGPRVRVVDAADVQVTAAPAAPPPPVSTISVAREITAEEAESVLLRLAPDRLKKKPGPKGPMLEVA